MCEIFTEEDTIVSEKSIRFTSIILSLFIVLSVFASLPLSAGAETEIESVALTVTAPKAGEHPVMDAVCEPEYYIGGGVGWYNVTDSKELTADDIFEAGKDYNVSIFIKPNSGYSFKANGNTPMITATVNGKAANVYKVFSYSPAGYVQIFHEFKADGSGGDNPHQLDKVIEEANITGVVEPKIGEKAVFSANTSDEGYTIKSVEWRYDNSWMNQYATYQAGKEYTVYVSITANDGYQFKVDSDESCAMTAYVNGVSANVNTLYVTDDAKKNLVVMKSFTLSEYPEFLYTVNNGTASITGYSGFGGDIEIPAEIDGYKVNKIDYNAFYDKDEITSVVIPSTVIEIDEMAFGDCSNLMSVHIPEGVEIIGVDAFQYCESLTSVTIPSTVTEMGDSVFYCCDKLEEVILRDGVNQIGGYAFLGCGALEYITIPESVTEIRSKALGYYYKDGQYLIYDGFTIYGYEGSVAETYANENGITFESAEPDWYTVSTSKAKYTYTGKEIKPSVTVTDSKGNKLVNGADYMLNYPKAVNVGLYIVEVVLQGKYQGVEYAEFLIIKAKNPMKVKASAKTVKLAAVKKKNVTVKAITVKKSIGKVTYKKASGNKKIKINSKTGKLTLKKGLKKGTYTVKVKVTAKGNKNYKAASKTVKVKIVVK